MGINRLLRGIAGFFILLSLLLAVLHSEWWLLFTAFVGANLLQSAFTDWCLMMTILEKMGFPRETLPGEAAEKKVREGTA